MKLTNDLRVRRYDTYNFVLELREIKTKGKFKGDEQWTNQGYFPNAEQACEKAARMVVDNYADCALTPQEFLEEIKHASWYIGKQFKEMVG